MTPDSTKPSTLRRLAGFAAAATAISLATAGAALASPSFPIDRTEATAGSPRMVAFELDEAATEDRWIEATSSDPGVLEVMEAGRVLAGETLGFVRVLGREPGEAMLRLEQARLPVEVLGQEAGALTRARTPRLVAPPAGAVVWGSVGVGAKWTDDLGVVDPASVRLRLPDGTRLEPLEHGPRGSDGWAAFEIDAATLPVGPLRLVVERPSAGVLPAADGEPILVTVADPATLTITAGEAEAVELPGPLPERLGGDRTLKRIDDADASGGRAVASFGLQPAFCVPIAVDTPGWYQAIARVRGSFSTGGFPAMGLGVDAEQYPREAGNSMGERWHRVAVGPPVRLTPPDGKRARGDREDRPDWLGEGERLVSFRFVNDHALPARRDGNGKRVGREDRNLFIDSWELARLPDDASPAGVALPVAADAETSVWRDRGDEPDRLHASLDPLAAGTRVTGGFTVRGVAGIPTDRGNRTSDERTPTSTLMVNGRPLGEQGGVAPVFFVPTSVLTAGTNELRLRTRLGDAEAWSEPLVVRAPEGAAAPGGATEPAARFSVDAAGWSAPDGKEKMPPLAAPRRNGVPVAELAFESNRAADLALPEEISGRFTGFLEGRPQWFGGPPRFSVELVTPGGTGQLGEFDLKSSEASFGEVELPAGPKTLRVAFTNDRYDAERKQDRNLYAHAIRLEPVGVADEAPPVAELRWPTPGATLGGFAFLVVDAADASGVSRAVPLLDGQPAGPPVAVEPGRGRFLVPLVLRGVSGEHRVSVRLVDAAENGVNLPPVTVRVSGDRGRRLAEAVFVLNRLGFGPEPAALADALVEGSRAWAIARLKAPDHAGSAAALARSTAADPVDFNSGHVQRRGLSWLIQTPDPLLARRVAFLDNHLTTWIQKVQSERQADAFGALVEEADHPFFELLLASATSPAMIRYLDQQRSFVGRINENYAREILELHTVGVHGGYTQKDITALAAVFTGITAANAVDNAPVGNRTRQAYAFVPGQHDPRTTQAFGLDLPAAETREGDGMPDAASAFDRIRRVLEALSAHPATAASIADKLADHHLGAASPGDPADAGVRDAMAAAFLRHQGRLPEVLLAMVEHPAFAAAMDRAYEEGPLAGARVARPLDAAVRLQRVLGQVEPGAAAGYLTGAGFQLFDRETPDGYPDEDAAYADSNAMLQRWRYASRAANRAAASLPHPLRRPSGDTLSDPAARAAWRQRVVDTLAGVLTGGLLSETSNAAALSVLEQAGEDAQEADVRTVAALISQLPEGALR